MNRVPNDRSGAKMRRTQGEQIWYRYACPERYSMRRVATSLMGHHTSRLRLTSRDFVPWRLLDAGPFERAERLVVAGVQNPAHKQTMQA